MEHDRIAVIDFGGQYAHLIATKVRRLDVLAEIRQPDDPLEAFAGFKGIIISGSPSLSAFGEDSTYQKGIYDLDVPILGFCFGHQEIAKHYGGKVEHQRTEFGFARLSVVRSSPLFEGLPGEQTVWMSHFDTVTELPEGFEETGISRVEGEDGIHRNAAIEDARRRRFGFQFHPEVDDTEHGQAMIRNFVVGVCGCRQTWTMERYIDETVERVRATVGERGVFLLVSGGVDSTVCAVLLGRALPASRLRLLHVDNGMMRKDESRRVVDEMERLGLGASVHFVDASDRFLAALDGLVEPEDKRKAIGEAFVDVFEDAVRDLGLGDMMLGQGTIYPDRIETGGTARADRIKTHHNRIDRIERMIEAGLVVEPLADLYKVEVRELGERLGIDPLLIWRHPFPGPGLGVRLLCCSGSGEPPATHDQAARAAKAAAVQPLIDALARPRGLEGRLLPVRTVGVKADLRAYEQPVALWGDAPFDTILALAARIYQEVPGVNRCVWDMTGQGIERAEPLAAFATRERFDLLREADDVVMRGLERHGLLRKIWQCPTVMVPMSVNGRGREMVVVRPILSERGMTARPAELPRALIGEIRDALLSLQGVGGAVMDVTTKPPGTIEWE